MSNDLENLIRSHVHLPNHPNPKGWFPVLCKVCNDHGRKGERAGFKFESSSTGYHCFNCNCAASFDPTVDEELSRDMKRVLRAYNIPESDWGSVLFDALVKRSNGGSKAVAPKSVEYEPEIIKMPPFFYPLADDPDDEWAQYAIYYLKTERGIDYKDYPFMLAKESAHPQSSKWTGRVITPIYKNNNLVFYQGRDMSGLRIKKYMSPGSSAGSAVYGFDKILSNADRNIPLYITEGFFDAFVVDGVAVFGNTLSPQQIYWLNRSPRPKVVIPDRFGDGHIMGKQALDMGWSIATPDIGSCKDVNEAVVKLGLLYVLDSIREHIYTGFEGFTRLGVYCE